MDRGSLHGNFDCAAFFHNFRLNSSGGDGGEAARVIARVYGVGNIRHGSLTVQLFDTESCNMKTRSANKLSKLTDSPKCLEATRIFGPRVALIQSQIRVHARCI